MRPARVVAVQEPLDLGGQDGAVGDLVPVQVFPLSDWNQRSITPLVSGERWHEQGPPQLKRSFRLIWGGRVKGRRSDPA
jgi:hypothetical protein